MHYRNRGLAVLVVDDDPDGADSLADVLRLAGHDVRVACTPTTAVIAAGSFPPDALIMDIGIPGMDGYRLARRLCELLGRKPLLVAVTGYAGLEDRSRREGFDHHFVKPADLAAVADVLSGHAARIGRRRAPDGSAPATEASDPPPAEGVNAKPLLPPGRDQPEQYLHNRTVV